jgi:predicted metal-dependent phosphoesterase TrpH
VRCDLHVHSRCSGPVDLPVLRHFGRECYSTPGEVYDEALRRGMNLVTLTDHDTIEGALEIRGLPDTFVSEEVTCRLPEGRELHLGVFDITEPQHERISRLRFDPEALFAYLAEARIPVCVNHLFSALTGRRRVADFGLALGGVSLIEARNGMMPARTNDYARSVGRAAGLGAIGGSDAHTLASVASAYTLVKGATTREDFLEGLRAGFTLPGGGCGSYARLTADVARIFASGYRESAELAVKNVAAAGRLAVMIAALPILPLIPLFTAVIYTQERLFATQHYRLFRASSSLRIKTSEPSGPWGPGAAASWPVQP